MHIFLTLEMKVSQCVNKDVRPYGVHRTSGGGGTFSQVFWVVALLYFT